MRIQRKTFGFASIISYADNCRHTPHTAATPRPQPHTILPKDVSPVCPSIISTSHSHLGSIYFVLLGADCIYPITKFHAGVSQGINDGPIPTY